MDTSKAFCPSYLSTSMSSSRKKKAPSSAIHSFYKEKTLNIHYFYLNGLKMNNQVDFFVCFCFVLPSAPPLSLSEYTQKVTF